MTEMGQRIRRLREERRLSQEALGDVLGVTGRAARRQYARRNPE